VEGRADLVAHGGEELGFGPVGGLGFGAFAADPPEEEEEDGQE
jgi:hypothetical protein